MCGRNCETGGGKMSVVPPVLLTRAELVEAPDDLDELIEFFHARRWSDGLPIVPPTRERVERMLACTTRKPDEVVANVAPSFGASTVERIAINAVMAGCR